MGFSMIGMVVVLAVVLVIGFGVFSIIRRLIGGRDDSPADSSSLQAAPGVTLNCPHCGVETAASLPQCQHCSMDL